jgi:formylglycine-generating enzyme required for sulfatase activity
LDKVAWYVENSGGVYHDVGTKLPNAWGVYDMHGNCWEWTLDKSSKRTSEPVWDPTGPMQDEADTGNTGNYKNKCMGAYGGRAWPDQYVHGCGAEDCTSAANRGLLTGEGTTCTIRLVIPLQ